MDVLDDLGVRLSLAIGSESSRDLLAMTASGRTAAGTVEL
jgi:hypothetical protein